MTGPRRALQPAAQAAPSAAGAERKHLRTFAALLLPALGLALGGPGPAAAETSPAPDGLFRIGVEAGAAWLDRRPNNATGPFALARLRFQPHDRIGISVGYALARQPLEEGSFTSTIVPLAAELRLDRAPVSPYVAAGWSLARFDLDRPSGRQRVDTSGPTLAFGVEARLSALVALTGQVTYFGLDHGTSTFPFSSAISAGVEACLF